jgi:5'-deoxynucleotidase YfbR-like HD superfamily hydrolase
MNVVNLFSALSGLSSVHRYSMTKLGNPESVLEHIGMVTIMANLIGREVNVISREPIIDLNSMTAKAIVHDLDELVVGDIPRPTKYRNEKVRSMFREIESWGVHRVLKDMGLSLELAAEMSSRHEDAKRGRDGLIVAIADSMAVVFKIWEEVIVRGNMSMVGHAVSVKGQLVGLQSKVNLEFEIKEVGDFLYDLLNDCIDMMVEADVKDDPIFGSGVRT